jgi:hypothetical protein
MEIGGTESERSQAFELYRKVPHGTLECVRIANGRPQLVQRRLHPLDLLDFNGKNRHSVNLTSL